MKLSDFARVGELQKEREYIRKLVALAGAHYGMRLDKLDVRPDLKAKLVEPMTHVFKCELARIERDLAAIGVEIDEATEGFA